MIFSISWGVEYRIIGAKMNTMICRCGMRVGAERGSDADGCGVWTIRCPACGREVVKAELQEAIKAWLRVQ